MIVIEFFDAEVRLLASSLPIIRKTLEAARGFEQEFQKNVARQANVRPADYIGQITIIDSMASKFAIALGIRYKGNFVKSAETYVEKFPDEPVAPPAPVCADIIDGLRIMEYLEQVAKHPESKNIIDQLWEENPSLMQHFLGMITAGMIKITHEELGDLLS